MEEQAKVPVFKGSLIYGVIVGIATIVVSLVLYFINQSLTDWAMIFMPILSVGLLVGALILFKKEYGKGFISFGRVIAAGTLISLFTAILSSGYTYAIYTMDDSYFQDTKYWTIDKVVERMDKMTAKYEKRMSDEQFEEIESVMKKQKKVAIKKTKERSVGYFAFSGIISSVILGVIISLIAGIFIKKEPKPIEP